MQRLDSSPVKSYAEWGTGAGYEITSTQKLFGGSCNTLTVDGSEFQPSQAQYCTWEQKLVRGDSSRQSLYRSSACLYPTEQSILPEEPEYYLRDREMYFSGPSIPGGDLRSPQGTTANPRIEGYAESNAKRLPGNRAPPTNHGFQEYTEARNQAERGLFPGLRKDDAQLAPAQFIARVSFEGQRNSNIGHGNGRSGPNPPQNVNDLGRFNAARPSPSVSAGTDGAQAPAMNNCSVNCIGNFV